MMDAWDALQVITGLNELMERYTHLVSVHLKPWWNCGVRKPSVLLWKILLHNVHLFYNSRPIIRKYAQVVISLIFHTAYEPHSWSRMVDHT